MVDIHRRVPARHRVQAPDWPGWGLGLGTRRGEGASARPLRVGTEAGTAEGRSRTAPGKSAPV